MTCQTQECHLNPYSTQMDDISTGICISYRTRMDVICISSWLAKKIHTTRNRYIILVECRTNCTPPPPIPSHIHSHNSQHTHWHVGHYLCDSTCQCVCLRVPVNVGASSPPPPRACHCTRLLGRLRLSDYHRNPYSGCPLQRHARLPVRISQPVSQSQSMSCQGL